MTTSTGPPPPRPPVNPSAPRPPAGPGRRSVLRAERQLPERRARSADAAARVRRLRAEICDEGEGFGILQLSESSKRSMGHYEFLPQALLIGASSRA